MDYKMQKVMFSSQRGDWVTPMGLFQILHREFDFTTDVCADINNILPNLYPMSFHSLTASWRIFQNRNVCYMNPPYGRGIWRWLDKAESEANHNGVTTVALLPARTDTNWFWTYCIHREIRLIKGRLHFSDKGPAPFPSMIVIFRP